MAHILKMYCILVMRRFGGQKKTFWDFPFFIIMLQTTLKRTLRQTREKEYSRPLCGPSQAENYYGMDYWCRGKENGLSV
jgi:hypothetical protein